MRKRRRTICGGWFTREIKVHTHLHHNHHHHHHHQHKRYHNHDDKNPHATSAQPPPPSPPPAQTLPQPSSPRTTTVCLRSLVIIISSQRVHPPYTHMHDAHPHYTSRVPNKKWCISSMRYSGDTPFWSETLGIISSTLTPQLIYILHPGHSLVSASVSAHDGIVVLGKAHTRSVPSLSSLPEVALETVPIFAWLNTDRSRPWRVECRLLPFSTPLSFRRSMLWCSGLSMFRKFLKPLSTSVLPSCRPDVISAVLASLSARSFPLTPA